MVSFTSFFYECISLLGNLNFLFAINLISLILKIVILRKLFQKNESYSRLFKLLVIVLICYMVQDCTWLFNITRSLWFPDSDYRPYLAMLRMSWGCFAVQYQALALFIEHVTHQQQHFNSRQKISIAISSLFVISAILFTCFDINQIAFANRPTLELNIRNIESIYVLLMVMLPSVLLTLHRMRLKSLPRILKQQLTILIYALIIPMWASDILQLFPLPSSPEWITNSYSAVGISTVLLTLAIYYCARRVIALRFLNFNNHVQSVSKFNFIDDFKAVLEQFSHATNYAELGSITQTLFKKSFDIPLSKTMLYIRKVEQSKTAPDASSASSKVATLVEGFLDHPQKTTPERLQQLKILIYDEIAFNCFHEATEENKALVYFLDTINADIFLPIYERNNLVAYIIVERHAQPGKFYGDVERDEMLVFASYLGNIINLLQSRNLKLLLHQEKELKEELYRKHQEINQYKESIRSFLRGAYHRDIGVIFYKNRSFVFGNKAAKELINFNVNTQLGHPLTKALQHIAKQVDEFKSPASCLAHDGNGNKLILAGVPNLERNNVIITVYRPELTDLIKQQIDALKDPSQWDYLLYLETTKSGKLINQLIPGGGETLLNFKISLLKVALSNKAILLQTPEEDLQPMVELLHHLSVRERLHSIKLTSLVKDNAIAIKIFGVNPLFGIQQEEKPLLEQLNETGTLFIQNVEYLDLETQKQLADFLKYGLFKMFKSDQHIPSNARVICSTNKNLQTLMHEGNFSAELFAELKEASLSMPSLLTLPEHELSELAKGLTEQALQTTDFKTMLELTDREKTALAVRRPASLSELRDKIQQLLAKKSKANKIENETHFDPAYQITDPQLIEAARLGRHALRDPRLVTMLWNKFKSQSKIAAFLGVNRSSVNRRCKDYNLL